MLAEENRGVAFGILGDVADALKLPVVALVSKVVDSMALLRLTPLLLPKRLPEGPACTGVKAFSVLP